MGRSAAWKQIRLIASQGMPPHQSIPLMLDLLEDLIPCAFATFFWLDETGFPIDSYLPVFIPSAMDAFIGSQRKLMADPHEPTIDKHVRLGMNVGAHQVLTADRAAFRKTVLYNEVFLAYGIGDALDLVVREDGRPRGMAVLNREHFPGRWSADELRVLAQMESHLLAALTTPPEWETKAVPGAAAENTAYLVADRHGVIQLATREAINLLAQFLDVPIAPDFRFADLLHRLPPAMMRLIERLQLISGGREAPAARETRLTRWGEISAHALRASPLDHPDQGNGQYVIVLEKRLTRAAMVARNVGRLPLAPRERQIAFLMGMDLPFAQAASRLGLSSATMRSYLRDIYDRTGTTGRDHLTAMLTTATPKPD